MKKRVSLIHAAGVLAWLAGSAHAQTCTPTIETFPSQPAVVGGYIQPIYEWDDGTGSAFFIGGSSENIGSANNKWIAKWDAASGTFSKLGAGIDAGTNSQFVASMVAVDFGSGSRLFVGGTFISAGGVGDTRTLAAWDGTNWISPGTGFENHVGIPFPAVWAMTTFNDGSGEKLVIGGEFSGVGSVAVANGLGMYDGSSWSGMGVGALGTVFALTTYDDGSGESVYAGGRLIGIGTGSHQLIGRWDGTDWQSVGGGTLFATSALAQVATFAEFDDGTGTALYVGGDRLNGLTFTDYETAKWDGTNWTAVGQASGGRTTALAVYDDGTGPALYQAGTSQTNLRYISRLENGTWVTLMGGIDPNISSISGGNPSAFGLRAHSTGLYIVGNFSEINGQSATGLARYTCENACYADCDGSGTLNIFDYICFGNEYAAGTSYADCDGSGSLNIFDYICFGNEYAAGCP